MSFFIFRYVNPCLADLAPVPRSLAPVLAPVLALREAQRLAIVCAVVLRNPWSVLMWLPFATAGEVRRLWLESAPAAALRCSASSRISMERIIIAFSIDRISAVTALINLGSYPVPLNENERFHSRLRFVSRNPGHSFWHIDNGRSLIDFGLTGPEISFHDLVGENIPFELNEEGIV